MWLTCQLPGSLVEWVLCREAGAWLVLCCCEMGASHGPRCPMPTLGLSWDCVGFLTCTRYLNDLNLAFGTQGHKVSSLGHLLRSMQTGFLSPAAHALSTCSLLPCPVLYLYPQSVCGCISACSSWCMLQYMFAVVFTWGFTVTHTHDWPLA